MEFHRDDYRIGEIRLMCSVSVLGVYIFKKKINRMYQQKWVNDLLFNTFAFFGSSTHHHEIFRKKRDFKGTVVMHPSARAPFSHSQFSLRYKYGKWSFYLLLVPLPSRFGVSSTSWLIELSGNVRFSFWRRINNTRKKTPNFAFAISKEAGDDDDLRSGREKKKSNVSRHRNLVSTLALTAVRR